ncbi:hypothetical protein OIV83_002538 [Microbotryomycetes sp. JL201]|nr:hypothetical protein OIV83_002538 [Microbotryomycetes sp. JL201]
MNTAIDSDYVFDLSQLPVEIVLKILALVDERQPLANFPAGPSEDLLNLSLTNKFCYHYCRPLVWKSVRYRSTTGTVTTPEFQRRRNLAQLLDLLNSSITSSHGPLPIRALSFEPPRQFPTGLDGQAFLSAEFSSLCSILRALARETTITSAPLQILFFEGSENEMQNDMAHELLRAVLSLPMLEVLRLNSLYIQDSAWLSVLEHVPQLSKIKTLQIMHGSNRLGELLKFAPNVQSLLIWSHARAFWSLMDEIIERVPKLVKLSLDAVNQPSLFNHIAQAIEKVVESGASTPLDELFLEGSQTPEQRTRLLAALKRGAPLLRRLALYHVHMPMASFLHEVADNLPDLESLALVFGDCSAPMLWPDSLSDYAGALSRFRRLRFFAWDRLPPAFISDQMTTVAQINYDSFVVLAQAVPSLTEVVNIVQDVSEGSTGWFGQIERIQARSTALAAKGTSGEKTNGATRTQSRMTVKHETRKDFLIGLDHFVVLERDNHLI